MIYTALDDFYLSAQEIELSPSRRAGVPAALEWQLRRFGCDVIAEAVVLLGLPQVVACTAQVLLQRFYCKRSLVHTDVKIAAMSSFWLAAKLEEVIEIDSPNKLRLRNVITVFYRVFKRREGGDLDIIDPYSSRYDEIKAEVVRGERQMLRSFGFIVQVEHPHRFVLTFGGLLGLGREPLQEAWNIANDSLRTMLCVTQPAECVACGVLFMALRRLNIPMPEHPNSWWEAFGVSTETVISTVGTMSELYTKDRPQYVALGKDFTADSKSQVTNNPPVSLKVGLWKDLIDLSTTSRNNYFSIGPEDESLDSPSDNCC